jgi:hypothetical protein
MSQKKINDDRDCTHVYVHTKVRDREKSKCGKLLTQEDLCGGDMISCKFKIVSN